MLPVYLQESTAYALPILTILVVMFLTTVTSIFSIAIHITRTRVNHFSRI